MIDVQEVIDYAKVFIGTPYIWGGNNPLTGFDCSGFVQWVLDSAGFDPRGDQTAAGLYSHFQNGGTSLQSPKSGAIVFYGRAGGITHVAMAINNEQVIEAAGGDSRTKTIKHACKRGACVRIKPYNYRKDLVAILLPKY